MERELGKKWKLGIYRACVGVYRVQDNYGPMGTASSTQLEPYKGS